MAGLEEDPPKAYFNCIIADDLYIQGLFYEVNKFKITKVQTKYDETTQEITKCIIDQIDGICMGTVGGVPGDRLEYLEDVNINNVTDGQVLKYDEASAKWINGSGGADNAMIKGIDYVTAGNFEDSTIGSCATVEGRDNRAIASCAHAEGQNSRAMASCAHAEGNNTYAYGLYSHAEGYNTFAGNEGAHVEGGENSALGENSHAEGYSTCASASQDHAEGEGTTAAGYNSHAEGTYTYAQGYGSHAEGAGTTAYGSNSHAEGQGTYAKDNGSHVEGYFSSVLDGGYGAHAEGYKTCVYFGYHTSTYGPHTEGYQTFIDGPGGHAEGSNTSVINHYQDRFYTGHAEGYRTYSYNGAHVEGFYNSAIGSMSHVNGCGNIVDGGWWNSIVTFVTGKYNCNRGETDANNYPFIIGNGKAFKGAYEGLYDPNEPDVTVQRSDAVLIDWNGNITAQSISQGSSRKVKENIQDMPEEEAEKLLQLRPVSFDYIKDEGNKNCYGLIAEEVQEAELNYPIFMGRMKSKNEECLQLDYSKFVPYLIKMIQIQDKKINNLEKELKEIKGGQING